MVWSSNVALCILQWYTTGLALDHAGLEASMNDEGFQAIENGFRPAIIFASLGLQVFLARARRAIARMKNLHQDAASLAVTCRDCYSTDLINHYRRQIHECRVWLEHFEGWRLALRFSTHNQWEGLGSLARCFLYGSTQLL